MPTISVFFGIFIRMYFDDHNPPHFHVHYGDFHATISIETLETIEGNLPKRALSMVLEWAAAHRKELQENWKLAEGHKPLKKIEPLD